MERQEEFVEQFKILKHALNQGFRLDDIIGLPVTTEGLFGEVVDQYGKFVLNTFFDGGGDDDAISELFWNTLVEDEDMTDKDIIDLFKELDKL